MNRLIAIMVVMIITLFSFNSLAWNPPASPKPDSALLDQGGVLSVGAHHRLDSKLTQINNTSNNEIAALIITSLDGQSIEDIAHATATAWGVGKKGLDNGVLVVIAMKEHKSRIETGKGVEGDLPDLKCNDILQNVVRPRMRTGDVEGALSAAFDAIASSIANHKATVIGRVAPVNPTTEQQPAPPPLPSCQVSNPGVKDRYTGLWFTFVAIFVLAFLYGCLRTFISRQAKHLIAKRNKLALKEVKQEHISKPTPDVFVPAHHRVVTITRPLHHTAHTITSESSHHTQDAIAAAALLAAEVEEHKRHRDREEEDRKRRDQDDEDRRKRESSSSSSFDWGGSSGNDSGSGGDFGGGSFGGGGSSSDW